MLPNIKLLTIQELKDYKLRILESIAILPNVSMFKKLLSLVDKEIDKRIVKFCNFT